MAKASVILPVWNDQDGIGNAVKSIREQTLKDIECIVVDDGSTDSSAGEAVNAIDGDKRFIFIEQKHQGLSCARNAGLDASSADIVFYVDADDTAMPKMVESAVQFIDGNSLDIAFFDAKVVPSNTTDRIMTAERKYFTRRKCYGTGQGRHLLKEMLACRDFVYAVFIQAARRSAVKERFCPGLRGQDELYTAENLILAERVGHLPEKLYVKRCRSNSVSNQRQDAQYAWSRWKSLVEYGNFFKRRCLPPEDAAIAMPVFRHMQAGVANSICGLNDKDRLWIAGLPLEERIQMELMIQIFNRTPGLPCISQKVNMETPRQ